MQLIDFFRRAARAGVRRAAAGLEKITRGKLRPDMITITGALAHVPIAWLIAVGHNVWAGVLLALFGLFDTLDGELARLQGRSSLRGMLLDASTDRLKETVLYTGVAYALASTSHPQTAALAAAACGASLSVSYVKAKGEAATALGGTSMPHETLNRLFNDGLLTFEVRIVLLVIGLVTNQLVIVTAVITVLAGATALQRLAGIRRRLA